jgi:hypothetical protein
MIIHLLGIHHNDPLSRVVCEQQLRRLSQEHTGGPTFVATEWDHGHFIEVKAQRPQLRQLFHARWPEATGELLDQIERTPGFEADAHESVFPTARMIWLDEGRSGVSENVLRFARYCMTLYQEIIGSRLHPDADATLRVLSRELWRRTEGKEGSYDRDREWIIKLRSVTEEEKGTWGIAIVGDAHLREESPHSFISLLRAEGFECHATSCRP